jgi:hypothetical protein
MLFDATVGGAAASSYVSVSDAADYFGSRLYAGAWDAADLATQQKALMHATFRLEQERFKGIPTVGSTQRLQWPRQFAPNTRTRGLTTEFTDGGPVAGYSFYPADVVPDVVKWAACELALDLLNRGSTDPTAPTGLEQFAHLKVGTSVDITPRTDGPSLSALPIAVVRWLRGLLETSTGSSKLVRG